MGSTRAALLGVIALGCGGSGPQGVEAAEPPPSAESSQEVAVSEFAGSWVYAQDPKGEAAFDPLYTGSTMHFREGGAYAYQMGGTTFALEGGWTVRSRTDSEATVDIAYGGGRKTVYHIVPRREGGAIVGLLVFEGEARNIPPRWVEPAP